MKPTKPNLIPCILLTALTTALLVAGSAFYFWYTVPYLAWLGAKGAVALAVIASYYRWLSLSGRRRPAPLIGGRLRFPSKGLLVGLVTVSVLYSVYLAFGDALDVNAWLGQLKNQLWSTTWLTGFALVAFVALSSFFDEWFFRGFLYNSLADLGFTRLALWATTIGYGAFFASLTAYWLPPLHCLIVGLGSFLVALGFTFANYRQSGILNSWLAHAGTRLIVVLLLLQVL